MNTLIEHTITSYNRADKQLSNLTNEILELDGMSGYKTRHYYNNICSLPGARYLEIGLWKGSTFCSAMYNNSLKCVGIDDWSQFNGPKDIFLENLEKYKSGQDVEFIEADCFNIDVSRLGKFNIYLYDGPHSYDQHYRAVETYLPCLDEEFILLIDDWNKEHIRDATLNAINDTGCEILYKKEIFTTKEDGRKQRSQWSNGNGTFVLKQNE